MAADITLLDAPSSGRLTLVRGRWAELPVIVRYGATAAVTQVLYLSAMAAVLSTGAGYLVALVTAQAVAICFAFPAYRGVVFRASGSLRRQVAAFAAVWWSGAVLSFTGVPLLVESLGLHPLVAQVCVLVLVGVWSFVGHARVTFRRVHA